MLRVFTLATAAALSAGSASAYQIEPALEAGTRAAFAAPAPAPEVSGRLAAAEPAAARMLSTGEPVTVTLDTADGPVLRSRFEGLSSQGAPLVRIFAGKPDATAETPPDDPHLAGTVAFYPVPLDGMFTATHNLADMLERTGQSGEIPVTYVIIPRAEGGETTVELAGAELTSAP